MTRLNYILGFPSIIPLLSVTCTYEISISERSPISVTIHDSITKPNTIMWRLPSHLINDAQFLDMIRKEWEDYLSLNAQHKSTPTLFWEAGKAHMRGRIILYVTAQKKQHVQKFKEASEKLRIAQQTYTNSPSPTSN